MLFLEPILILETTLRRYAKELFSISIYHITITMTSDLVNFHIKF